MYWKIGSYFKCIFVRVAKSRRHNGAILGVSETSKGIKSTKLIGRWVLVAVVVSPVAFATLEQTRSSVVAGRLLQPAVACLFQHISAGLGKRVKFFRLGVTFRALAARRVVRLYLFFALFFFTRRLLFCWRVAHFCFWTSASFSRLFITAWKSKLIKLINMFLFNFSHSFLITFSAFFSVKKLIFTIIIE